MRRILLASLVLAFAFSKLAFSASAADTTPPTLLSAVRHSTNLFEIFLTFSERMETNALEVTNYVVKSGATFIPVNDVYTPGNGKLTTNVIVNVQTELSIDQDFVLIVKNVSDTNANFILPVTNIIATVDELLISGSTWDYSDGGNYNEWNSVFYDNSWAQPDPNGDLPLHSQGISPFYRGWAAPGLATAICCWNSTPNNEHDFTSSAYYYRTTVDVNGSLFNGTMSMRVMGQDGAVVYVNGKEVYRTNIAVTVLQPVYTTLATATIPPAKLAVGTGRIITLPASAFNPGLNWIAVETHSKTKSSPTVVQSSGFDFELIHRYTNRLTGAVKITRQPQDLTVVEGTPAKFDVEHDGKPAYKYQWSKGAAIIPGATNRVLTLPQVTLADSNTVYSVKVTGATLPAATSSNAVLRVIADTNAPAILSALLDDAGTNIVITFSERMKVPAALSIANYTITNLQGGVVGISAITNADDTFSSFIITPTSVLVPSTRYYIVPKNLTDNAGKANPLPAGSAVSVGGVFTVVEMESAWRYFAAGTTPPVVLNGPSWTQKAYDDSSWSVGNSLFGFDDNAFLALDWSTPLPFNGDDGNQIVTYYFRRTFEGGGPTNGLVLTLSHIIDDGAVFYLNGAIASRFNMASPVSPNYTNKATASVDNGVLTENIKFPLTNLVAGINQLAVEVHQQAIPSGDIAFAMQLDQAIPSVVITASAVNAKPAVTVALGGAANTSVPVDITATASDSDGTVVKVEFFDGATKLGEDTTSPYSFSWTPATAGSHTIKAVATDNGGATGEASTTVTVTDLPTPKLTITRSADGKTALISWTATPGFALQSATKLAPTADWTAVAGAGASSYTATLSAGSPRYYRLLKP